jgi:hypothetical protein
MIVRNPLTTGHNEFWRKRIVERFAPNESLPSDIDFLSLKDYLVKHPQKCYSQQAFTIYFNFLNELLDKEPNVLRSLFDDKQGDISIANRVLNEVNNLESKNELIPKNDSEVISLIQNKIIYNYLRVLEAPFYTLIYLAAKKSRLDRQAKTEGLDIYNSINELIKTNFKPILNVYDGTLRNAIAHGKFLISSLSGLIIFTFSDSKGHTVEYEAKKLIDLFDKLLDITNAFYLAYKLFCLVKYSKLKNINCNVAYSIYIDEIIASANGPNWEIINMYEISKENNRHLSVYIKSSFWAMSQDRLQAINTSIIVSKFFREYDIIYLEIISKYASISVFHINSKKLVSAVSSN